MSLDSQQVEEISLPVGGATLRLAWLTDIGNVRSENQDRVGWCDTAHGLAVTLADGMGGGVGGGEAAQAAVAAVLATLTGAGATVEAAVRSATAAVRIAAVAFGPDPVMGTTLLVATLDEERLRLASVGDSRAYLVAADGELTQLSRDHTRAAELVLSGELTAAEARRDGRRNMLTRAVTVAVAEPDVIDVVWREGDTLALCSDGVWEPLDDQQLAGLWAPGDLAAAVLDTCQAALDAGSRDNVTVLLARLSA